MSSRPVIRIFISSPSDVRPERLRAEAIVARLNNEFAYHFAVEAVLWEREPLVAAHHFQHEANIPQPHTTDIVVVILWTRLGVTLPPDQFLGALSGRPVTGTEWEFEDALAAARAHGTPDLLLYRKDAPPTADLSDRQQLQDRLAQLDLLEAFIARWFRSQDGQGFVAASHSFGTATEFEDKLYEHLRALLERRTGASSDAAPIRWHDPPFRGLAPFEQAQSAVFFGRTRARNELRDVLARRELRGADNALRNPAFILVLGASGSGKSSLVKAGLLPDLLLPGMIGRVALLRHATLRPADGAANLVAALAAALLSPTALPELAALRYTPDRLADLLRTAPAQAALPVEQGLAEAARAAALAPQAQSRLLLILDQLEELFTAELDPTDRDRFVAAIAALASTGSVWVVATMRSDFFDRLELLPELARLAAGDAAYRLLPPDLAELAQIIRQPAREAGLRFAVDARRGVALDEVVLQAAGRDRGALPLLSFLLDQLWQHRTDRGELTFEAYETLGELEGALGSHAEAVYAAQPPALQQALPTLLRALVTLGSGAQPTVAARTAGLDAFPEATPARALLDAFLHPAARLLVSDQGGDEGGGGARIRVAHEALLTHWPRARDWIAERPADLQLEERIEAEAARWSQAAEPHRPSLLRPAGLPLSEAQDLLARRREDLSAPATAYIEASLAQEAARSEAERRRALAEQQLKQEAAEAEAAHQRQSAAAARKIAARTRAGLLVACALLVVAAGLAWLSYRRTQQATEATARAETAATIAQTATAQAETRLSEARLNASRFMTEHAEAQLRAGQPELAGLLARAALPDDLAHPDRPVWYPAASVIGDALSSDRALAVLPHAGAVVAVAASPDGTRIATASWDGTARLWNGLTGRPIATMPHGGWVVAVAFSPDGARLATGSLDNTAKLWDGRTGAPLATLAGHTKTVNAVAFSPNGARVATAANDGAAKVWDAASGKLLATMQGPIALVRNLAWSPDGTQLLTGATDNTARIWDAATGEQRHLLHETGWLNAVAWSPDGASVLTAAGNVAKLWDASTGELRTVYGGHTGDVWAAAFSPDGTQVATASADHTALLFSVEGQSLHVLRAHADVVLALQFSADGHALVTASGDGTARLWDTGTGELLAGFFGHTLRISAAALTAHGARLATASNDGTARIWNARPTESFATQDRQPTASTAIAWSPDGKRFATASSNDGASVWDAVTGARLARLLLPPVTTGILTQLEWSPDGTRLLGTGIDKQAHVWDAATGAQALELSDDGAVILKAHFSPDGGRILTAGFDGNIREWDAATGQRTVKIAFGALLVSDAQFSPDGTRIAAYSISTDVPVWDSATGRQLALLHGHTANVIALAWSPDGKRLLTGSFDRTARTWDAATGAPLATYPTAQATQVLAWSPGGDSIAFGSYEGPTQVVTPAQTLQLSGGRPAFSPDGKRIAAISPGFLVETDLATGAVVAVHGEGRFAQAAYAWSPAPGSARLLVAGPGHAARIWPSWPLATQDTVAYADIAALRQLSRAERASAYLDGPAPPPGPPAAECDRLAADPADPSRAARGIPFAMIDAAQAIPACKAAAQAAPNDPRLRYQLARALQRQGDQPAAATAYAQAPDYPPALWALGEQLQFGTGLPADPARAIALFHRAADARYAPAALRLAFDYADGSAGLPKDTALSDHWLSLAAEEGDPTAHILLASAAEAANDPATALLHDAIAKRLMLRSAPIDLSPVLYRTGALARLLGPVRALQIDQDAAAWSPSPPP